MVHFTLDPNELPQLSGAEKARLDRMTAAEITATAESDPDNLPFTNEELETMRARNDPSRPLRS